MLVVRAGEREQVFTNIDLSALPGQIADIATRLPGRQGSGVLLSSVLEAASVPKQDSSAEKLLLVSRDGSFQTEVPRSETNDALLVFALEGQPLPEKLGGPVRFFLHDAETCRGHGDAPCANVKDLAEIKLVWPPYC